MQRTQGFFEFAQRQGDLLVARVLSRDDIHLAPKVLRLAAIARLRRGIRALEAFLRRLLILMALALEPSLKPDQTERPTSMNRAKSGGKSHSFPIFIGERAPPDIMSDPWAKAAPRKREYGRMIPAGPLIAHFYYLKTLLEQPEKRARHLAFHLARRRPGLVIPPGLNQKGVPNRYGTEVSALYDAMAQGIWNASRARPPPLGPVPRPPPRIRLL